MLTTSNRAEVRFDAKRRVVIPVALMAAAGLDYTQPLVIIAEPGRLVIEDQASSLSRVRDNILAKVRPTALVSEWDAVADIREMREDDIALSERNDARREAEASARSADDSIARGRTLLDTLGL